ncbi:Ribosomal RNA small subunit methyltransferase A [bacterium HR19]|nr:Ribosomal RNA small subunit methyltransferase A [bacterium HR19]
MSSPQKKFLKKIIELYIIPKRRIIPRKSMGQNKLAKPEFLEKISSFATEKDVVIEVGGGEGNLTELLEENSLLTISFEPDERLFENLIKRVDFGIFIKKDFFEFEFEQLKNPQEIKKNNPDEVIIKGDEAKIEQILKNQKTFKIISNIPFYISSPLIHRIVLDIFYIKSVHILVQKEFAEKISAKEGESIYSAISCITRFFYEPKIEFIIPNFFFIPRPEVHSAFISLYPKEESKNLFDLGDARKSKEMIAEFIDFTYSLFKRRKKAQDGKRVYELSPDEVFDLFKKRKNQKPQ